MLNNILQYLDATARRVPDKTAFSDGGSRYPSGSWTVLPAASARHSAGWDTVGNRSPC